MSATANWSYTNVATVRPRLKMDLKTQQTIYGDEYQIACTWIAKGEQMRDGDGAEFVSRHQIFTEDKRPKFLDLVSFDGSNGWEEIRTVLGYDMSFFDEEPDFTLVT